MSDLDDIMRNSFTVLINRVRSKMRDYAPINRLIEGEESSDLQIAYAIVDVLEDFNNTPPFTKLGLPDFPVPNILVLGVCAELLQSLSILQARNYLPYSDGGISFSISDKSQLYQAMASTLSNQYEAKKTAWKIANNYSKALGYGAFSEYSTLHGLLYSGYVNALYAR